MTALHVPPRAFADLLDNAVVVGKDKPGVSTNSHVALMVRGAELTAYGRGRYLAGRSTLRLEAPADPCTVTLLEDVAAELAGMVRKVEGVGRKDTRVHVVIDGGLAVNAGDVPLCDLEDEDPDGASAPLWTEIDAMLAKAEKAEACAAFMFTKEMMQKISKLKGDADVVDLVRIGGGTMAFRIGTTFQGLAEGVDRGSHAKGGRYGDGPGKPSHLWGAARND